MSKFPEKLWTLGCVTKDILAYLYVSETEKYAIYSLLEDISSEVCVDKSMIISKGCKPKSIYVEEAYWEDYSAFLKHRNALVDRLLKHYREKIKKLRSSKVYE